MSVVPGPEGDVLGFPPTEGSKVGELSVKGPLWRERAILEEERAEYHVATSSAAMKLVRVQEQKISDLERSNTIKDVLMVAIAVLGGVALGWGLTEALDGDAQ